MTAMAVASLNIWTGAPLLAVWIGSRVVGDSQVTMGAVALVAISLLAFSLGLVRLLGLLGAVDDRVTGRRSAVRQHTPWLRSMRGERPHEQGSSVRPSPMEAILIVSVVLGVAAFEIWFFFYSGSSIDQRSGRD
jgi:hypothetical protein